MGSEHQSGHPGATSITYVSLWTQCSSARRVSPEVPRTRSSPRAGTLSSGRMLVRVNTSAGKPHLSRCRAEWVARVQEPSSHPPPTSGDSSKEQTCPHLQKGAKGTSLAVQWLGFCASTAGGTSSIPDQVTKILHAARHGPPPPKKLIKINK